MSGSGKATKAVLETNELVNFAETIDELLEATLEHELVLTLNIELKRTGGPTAEAVNGTNAFLEKVKEGWTLR